MDVECWRLVAETVDKEGSHGCWQVLTRLRSDGVAGVRRGRRMVELVVDEGGTDGAEKHSWRWGVLRRSLPWRSLTLGRSEGWRPVALASKVDVVGWWLATAGGWRRALCVGGRWRMVSCSPIYGEGGG